MVGPIHSKISAHIRVVSSDAAGCRLDQQITSAVTGKPDFHIGMGCQVSPEGQVSEITGVDMGHPTAALIARNAAVGLPALPNEPVTVGSTWDVEIRGKLYPARVVKTPFYAPAASAGS